MELRYQKTISGQSLFEVVVAIGITALILVGAISLSTASVRNSNFAKNDSVATKFSLEGSEWLREQRDTDWVTFIANTGKTCLGTLSWSAGCTIPNTAFTRNIAFRCYIFDPGPPPVTSGVVGCGSIGVNQVETTVSVRWTDSQGTHKVDSVNTLTRWH